MFRRASSKFTADMDILLTKGGGKGLTSLSSLAGGRKFAGAITVLSRHRGCNLTGNPLASIHQLSAGGARRGRRAETNPSNLIRSIPAEGSSLQADEVSPRRSDRLFRQELLMSANPKDFLQPTSTLSHEATRPFPAARQISLPGSRPDIRVGMREVTLPPTPSSRGPEENPPITVYDTSG